MSREEAKTIGSNQNLSFTLIEKQEKKCFPLGVVVFNSPYNHLPSFDIPIEIVYPTNANCERNGVIFDIFYM